MYYTKNEDYLAHHGILGQKWGVRRYQNPDGTLTKRGKERYSGHKDDLVYKKGTEFEHLSLNKNLKLSEDKTYLSSED